jgi:2-dehydropantoate 2-reductase
MRVRLVGLGAVGAGYGSRFLAAGTDFAVVADAARAQRYQAEPTLVNGHRQDFAFRLPGQDHPVELVVIAVKADALSEAIELVRGCVGPETVVLSLLNGIDSEKILQRAFPQAEVPLALSVGIDAVRDGRQVHYNSLGRIVFGPAAGEASVGLSAVADLFAEVGIAAQLRTDMVHQLWWKFMINVGVNQVSAVLGAPYRAFQSPGSPAREAMLAAQAEVIAVAAAEGVRLTEVDVANWLEVLSALGPDNYTSMAQDALAGRATEVDIFAGRVCELGREHAIPTPVNDLLRQLLLAQPAVGPRTFGP